MERDVFTLFCDDVRQEVSGKQTLVGVYGSDVQVDTLPTVLPLALLIRLRPILPGRHKFTIRIETPGGGAEVQGEMEVAAATPGTDFISLGTPPIPISLAAFGDLVATLSMDGQPQFEVGRLPIRKHT